MNIYIRLLKYLLPYKFPIFISIVCMVIFAAMSGFTAYLIGPVIKFLFVGDGGEAINLIPYNLFPVSKEKMMVAVPVLIIVVAIIKGFSSYGQTYLMGWVGQRVVTDIRDKLYRHILDMPVDYFVDNPTGALIARITNDVNMLRTMTTETFARLLKQSFTIVVLVCVVLAMDWKLAIAALVAFPLVVYPMLNFGKKVKKISRKRQETVGLMSSILHEAITGIRIVKAFCMENYEGSKFDVENERLATFQMRNIQVRAIASPMMEVVGAVGFAATILYASYRISAGTLAPENFISFFAASMMLYQPIKTLNGVNLNIQNGLAAAQRIFEVMDVPSELDTLGGDSEITGLKEAIEYRGVSFSYGDKAVLRDIDIKVRSGEIVAFVGLSGAGKTTLVSLLPRFAEVTRGSIFIDDIDIREIKATSLRSQIALVS
ncbi:MAG: ABC transporter ATP-binding protein, partial [Thermodesulfobacteriota bacterium]